MLKFALITVNKAFKSFSILTNAPITITIMSALLSLAYSIISEVPLVNLDLGKSFTISSLS